MKIFNVFTDGSYSPKYPIRIGAGIVVVENDEIIEEFMLYRDSEEMALMRQICGELIASMESVRIAIQRGYDKIQIFYDYEGIEKWYDSSWKCKNQYTKAYKEYMHKMNKYIDIEFVKCDAHTGDYYNELADYFAKNSLEL